MIVILGAQIYIKMKFKKSMVTYKMCVYGRRGLLHRIILPLVERAHLRGGSTPSLSHFRGPYGPASVAPM